MVMARTRAPRPAPRRQALARGDPKNFQQNCQQSVGTQADHPDEPEAAAGEPAP